MKKPNLQKFKERLKQEVSLNWIIFVVSCAAITCLMTVSISKIPTDIAPGMIATRDIKADRSYEIIDEEATNQLREETPQPNVYDYDYDALSGTMARVSQMRLDAPTERAVKSILPLVLDLPIVADKKALLAEGQIILRETSGEEVVSERLVTDMSGLRSIEEAKRRLRAWAKTKGKAVSIVEDLLEPNASINLGETSLRRERALQDVKNVVVKIQTGEAIIRSGSRFEPRHIMILKGIEKEKARKSVPLEVAGTFIIVASTILTIYYFARRYIRKFAPQKMDILFMGTALVCILIVLRILLAIFGGIHDAIAIPRAALNYAIPVAGGAMLVRLILNSESAMIFAIVASIFSGVFVENDLNFTAYSLISSVVAAASVAHADKRTSIIKAGSMVGMVNILAAIGIRFINLGSIYSEPLTIVNLFWYVVLPFLGGFGVAIFVTAVTPLFESIFGYATDIKLLELANLNHPLLRELVIRAPGTYHHSHLVGILAENACQAIGANPLIARVAAYYHDVGKIKKPQYFVENIEGEESKHDKLSPSMSALIIASHVKDGLEMAKAYKLPKKILDMITQHHGTKKIGYFYEKALELADLSLERPDERDFRYPGPKPQTREAGVLMLADAVEATVRALPEKVPTRIQQTVEDVINLSFVEGQLSECDLTLRNLNDIASTFSKILMGLHHQRIEYSKEVLNNNHG